MKFLLDTDTCIYALKRERGVLERLLAHSPAEIAVSVITEAELRTGAAKSDAAAKTGRLVENSPTADHSRFRFDRCPDLRAGPRQARTSGQTDRSPRHAHRGTRRRAQADACLQQPKGVRPGPRARDRKLLALVRGLNTSHLAGGRARRLRDARRGSRVSSVRVEGLAYLIRHSCLRRPCLPQAVRERMIKSPPIDHIPRGLRRPERRLQ